MIMSQTLSLGTSIARVEPQNDFLSLNLRKNRFRRGFTGVRGDNFCYSYCGDKYLSFDTSSDQ